MIILFYGGQKSGKSKLAEEKTLELCKNKKPFYIATYDNSYDDKEMSLKLEAHQKQREDKFISIEEAKDLTSVIRENETYLVDCLSMWILNNLEENEEFFINALEKISKLNAQVVFVLNDVNHGVIPLEKTSRKFVDLSGIVGQKVASLAANVYEVKLGLEIKLK